MNDDRIWKHKLPWEESIAQQGFVSVPVPKSARVLSIGVQNEVPVFWEQHTIRDEDDFQTAIRFKLVETGKATTVNYNKSKFLGTLMLAKGRYVVHVFQEN